MLEKLDIPMLWALGGKDIEAPNEVTIAPGYFELESAWVREKARG